MCLSGIRRDPHKGTQEHPNPQHTHSTHKIDSISDFSFNCKIARPLTLPVLAPPLPLLLHPYEPSPGGAVQNWVRSGGKPASFRQHSQAWFS